MINTMFDAWTAMAFGGMGNLLPRTARAPLRHKVGRFSGNEFRNHAGALQYKLYIPGSYDGTPMPLIVMLHGCGQNADDFALGTGMNELAEEYGCLVLYPEQSRSANWHACWNWFDEAHHGRDKGEPALIAGLTQSIMANYAVDEQSVSIAGLSAGGAMAVILGRTYPDLYTAVGCHSGLAHGSATSGHGALTAMRDGVQENLHGSVLPRDMLANGVPIIVFHGDQDETVHLSHSSGVVRQSIGVCDPCMVETAA
jgi:poly(hydroxyalkanoate) depolymerase family esterase